MSVRGGQSPSSYVPATSTRARSVFATSSRLRPARRRRRDRISCRTRWHEIVRRLMDETESAVLEAHAMRWLRRAPRPEASLTGDSRPGATGATGADDEADDEADG